MQGDNNQREHDRTPEPSGDTVIARGLTCAGYKKLAAVMIEYPEFFAWQRISEPPRERVVTNEQ